MTQFKILKVLSQAEKELNESEIAERIPGTLKINQPLKKVVKFFGNELIVKVVPGYHNIPTPTYKMKNKYKKKYRGL